MLVFGIGLCAAGPLDDQPVEKDRGAAKQRDPKLPTLWIIGDSTVKVGTPGQRGWGEEIATFFDTSKINVVNRAIGGRSSRTFMTDGRWDDILDELKKGDVVIMQFGHNDASPINEDPPINDKTRARGTIRSNGDETVDVVNILTGQPETVHSYGWYLRQFASTAKDKGARAVICSPIPRKTWQEDGTIARCTDSWTKWAREAAGETDAQFIDLNDIIACRYEEIGKEAVEPLFGDHGTHTSPKGAAFNARAVVSGLNALDPNPVAFALSEDGQEVAAFHANDKHALSGGTVTD